MSPDDRRALIRLDFELMRDITWFKDLAPKCKEEGLSAARMDELREAWNVYAEARNWAWWQEHTASHSHERLEDSVMDSREQLDALGVMEWRQESEYTRVIREASRHPVNDNKKGIDR